MIFTLPTLKDTMAFPSFPARLVAVRGEQGEREFMYRMTMEVDIGKCISNDALTMEVEVYRSKPQPALKRKPQKMGSARSFTRSTKRLERNLRKSKKKVIASRVTYRRVDLTNFLSNSQAREVKRRKHQRLLKAAAATKLSKSLSNSGVSSGKSSASSMSPFAGKTTLKTSSPIASPLVSQPIKTTISPKTTVPLKKFSSGLLASKTDPGSLKKTPILRLQPAVGAKAQSMMFTPAIQRAPTPLFRIVSRKRKITFRLVVSEKNLKSATTFYMRTTIKNDKGVKLEQTGTTIQHSKLLNDYLTPIREPHLEVSIIKAGMISVGVKQVDPKAKFVRVFRRTAPAETGGSDGGTPWTEIIETPLLRTDDELRFKDEFATSRTLLYRAIALGENMRPTEEFSSSVLLPIKELKMDQTTALSAVATSARNGKVVKITVSDIPADAVSVMVRKFDMTKSSYADFKAGKNSGFEYVGSTPEKQSAYVVADADASFDFYDKRVKSGREYRYVPVAIMKRGKEIIGTEAIMEIPDAADDNDKVNLTTPTPVVIVKSGVPVVSFSLKADFTDFGFEEVQESLAAAKQADLFQQDVVGERGNFSELISFLVERENFTTGEVESFGVHKQGDFEDSIEAQKKNNVSSLQLGVRYGYRITALVRSPESLFPKLATQESDPVTLLRYRRAVAKFRNPLALRKATLQSTSRQNSSKAPSRIEPSDPFLQGRTNVQARVEVSVPVPKRPGPRVTTENRGTNRLVKWTYFDDITRIDHFQVYACFNGGRNLLGTVHADSASAQFSFRHFTKDYSVSYFYEVHAIQLDYKRKERIRSARIKPKKFEKQIKTKSRRSKKIVRL